MIMESFLTRVVNKYRRAAAEHLCRRIVTIKTTAPIISFSFDDAPRTAFIHGGDILNAHGAGATYYVSLGLLNANSPSGVIASQADLRHALDQGHELGSHTFDHNDSWETKTELFVQAVLKNQMTLSNIMQGAAFKTFAYPSSQPRPDTKRRIGELFPCCRGGGQTLNRGTADLNLLKAFFLDVRNGNAVGIIKRLIDKNAESCGWLIFATHDVDYNPSRYGCTKKFFEEVVEYAVESGAILLPVGQACEQIQTANKEQDIAP
jgi:peptidoglycan/xylan/chitin deacetylase (PgdA/CDA1 family)